jgi:TolB-like protein/DNA-binding winged helix-turn-helix (wHTH) protein/Tfp pilus assembly protein PilF
LAGRGGGFEHIISDSEQAILGLGRMLTKVWARFGEFELDAERGLMSVKGYAVKLQLQPLRVLELLVRKAPGVVSRAELGDFVWGPGVHVELDANLYYCIRQIRLALKDSATVPRYVETLPKQGYRLVAAVELVTSASDLVEISHPPSAVNVASASTGARRWTWLAVSLVSCAVLVVGIGWLARRHVWAETPIRSIVVLPLENLSGDTADDYFADGTTDELITELATLPNLRVVSRTSAMLEKGSHKTLREIAGELNVDAVVEGSVMLSGNRVRITAQLIDARDDRHLWARSFEGPSKDIVTLQDRVANEIATQTRAVLMPERGQNQISRPVNPTAYDAYLRGRYFYAKQDILRSAEYFQKAIVADPSYASAYAGLADDLDAQAAFNLAPVNEAMPKALAAAQHAIELDPKSGEAYEALGSIETIYEWNWEAAERDLARSMALSPSYSVAEMKYATYLDATGRPEEAVSRMRRAVSLDPLSFYMVRRLGATLYLAREYDGALDQLRRAAEMEPGNPRVVDNWVSVAYEQKGMHDEAVEHDLAALQSQWPVLHVAELHEIYKGHGWTAYWRARTKAILPFASRGCLAYNLGTSYLRLGDLDEAFAAFNRVVDGRCFEVVLLKTDPVLDPIRADKRYQSILKRVNLEEK